MPEGKLVVPSGISLDAAVLFIFIAGIWFNVIKTL
jgi:hypothetical protein